MTNIPNLGVVICTFNSADVILDCLESLMASTDVALSVVVSDNGSTDNTVSLIRDWADGLIHYSPPVDCPIPFSPRPSVKRLPLDGSGTDNFPHRICLIENGVNGGFAAGVNVGLAALALDLMLDRFWILNPDSMVPSGTAHAFAIWPVSAEGFSLMGGRVNYFDEPNRIQIDGGTINRWTGVTGNLNLDASHATTPPPDTAQIDFITGASMVASRRFYETVGPMPEDYFLYYEEVDWALRRGHMPLVHCPAGLVYHRAGTSTGSATLGRPASPFSLYFKHRARMRFMKKYFMIGVPIALLFSIAKAIQLFLKGHRTEAITLLGASFDLPPPAIVRSHLSTAAQKRAF